MEGTYEDVSLLKLSIDEIPPISDSSSIDVDKSLMKSAKQIQGQPLLPKHEKEQEETPFNEYQLPVEDVETDQGEIVNQTFTISPLVRNINAFLTGPLQHNMQLAEYLSLVPENTNTICSLHGRNIRITGTLDAVQLAYEKFSVIQKTHVGCLFFFWHLLVY
jgi:hypothetical protein